MRRSARARYAGYRFPTEIIGHAVWLYFRSRSGFSWLRVAGGPRHHWVFLHRINSLWEPNLNTGTPRSAGEDPEHQVGT